MPLIRVAGRAKGTAAKARSPRLHPRAYAGFEFVDNRVCDGVGGRRFIGGFCHGRVLLILEEASPHQHPPPKKGCRRGTKGGATLREERRPQVASNRAKQASGRLAQILLWDRRLLVRCVIRVGTRRHHRPRPGSTSSASSSVTKVESARCARASRRRRSAWPPATRPSPFRGFGLDDAVAVAQRRAGAGKLALLGVLVRPRRIGPPMASSASSMTSFFTRPKKFSAVGRHQWSTSMSRPDRDGHGTRWSARLRQR